MKELNIFIFSHDLSTVTEILRRHNIAGMAFSEIHATGHTKRKEIPEMVRHVSDWQNGYSRARKTNEGGDVGTRF